MRVVGMTSLTTSLKLSPPIGPFSGGRALSEPLYLNISQNQEPPLRLNMGSPLRQLTMTFVYDLTAVVSVKDQL